MKKLIARTVGLALLPLLGTGAALAAGKAETEDPIKLTVINSFHLALSPLKHANARKVSIIFDTSGSQRVGKLGQFLVEFNSYGLTTATARNIPFMVYRQTIAGQRGIGGITPAIKLKMAA